MMVGIAIFIVNDLINDLELSKRASDILSFRFKESNLVPPTNTSVYRTMKNNLLFFSIFGLMSAMGLQNYFLNDCHLFIDSLNRSLKCVLLHNGSKLGSLSIVHSTKVKEEFPTILVMEKIKYLEHNWVICVDLKTVNFLLGQQCSYSKNLCFIYLSNSRETEHCTGKDWVSMEVLVLVGLNVINAPLVLRYLIIIPLMHIHLQLMTHVKSLYRNEECFNFIAIMFEY